MNRRTNKETNLMTRETGIAIFYFVVAVMFGVRTYVGPGLLGAILVGLIFVVMGIMLLKRDQLDGRFRSIFVWVFPVAMLMFLGYRALTAGNWRSALGSVSAMGLLVAWGFIEDRLPVWHWLWSRPLPYVFLFGLIASFLILIS